jgi:hypothetical protein
VAGVRRFRIEASPLLVVGAWGLLYALTAVWIAIIPGQPEFSRGVALLGAVLIVLVFFGSRWAWWLAIYVVVVQIGGAVALVLQDLMNDDVPLKPFGFGALSIATFWLIWKGSVEDYVLADGRGRRETTPLH